MHGIVAAVVRALPGFSPRLAFGCRSDATGLKSIDRNFNALLLRLSLRRGGTKNRCPVFHRALLSVVAPTRSDKKSLPEISTRPHFGAWNCRGDRPGVALFFAAPCFRLSLRRGQTKNHCPKLQRDLSSVHGIVAAVARALPGFSPRLAFGCRPSAVREKIIARNFNAALARCIDLSRQLPGRCPVYYRALLSVVAPTRSDKKSLPEISMRLYFGAWNCRGSRPGIARFFTATCFRLSAMRGRTENYCLKLHRALLSVVAPARRDKKSLPGFSPRLALGCRSGAAGQKFIARFFTATCFRLSLRRDQTKIHCPKLQRGLSSVHGIVAAAARALPGFSPRLAFGCRSDAVRQKSLPEILTRP